MLDLPRKRSRALLALAGAALVWGAPALAEDADSGHRPRVTAVRFWSLGDSTRIAVEATGQFHFRYDRLQNPERIFFDLIGTRPEIGDGRHVTVIPVGDPRVRQIRVAETQKAVTRIVLDLAAGVQFSTSQLANPDRLMIELRLPGAVTPSAATATFRAPERRPVEPASTQPMPDAPPAVDASIRTADPLAKLPEASPTEIRNAPVTTLAKASLPATAPATPAPLGLPAKRNLRGDTMTRVLGLKVGRVVLDPGHGGHDTGTIGPGGLREKDLVLDVSKRLGALIEERMGSEVVYTRSDDTFIPLGQRTALANDKHADLFLSIHANSSALRTAAGVETFYLSFTASRSALETAARENAGSEKTIYELEDLLKKIALRDKVDESREFAARLQSSLYSVSSRTNSNTKDRGIKKAPFVVLIGAQMPSVLAEIGFVSNSRDEAQMRRPEYRQRLAEALYKGLASYASTLSHFQVAQHRAAQD
jgi:N-acetylmuramoyl-L-alanine amidase